VGPDFIEGFIKKYLPEEARGSNAPASGSSQIPAVA